MRYFARRFVPLVSAPVPTLRLAHNRLVINTFRILFVVLRSERNFNVRNFVPSEVEVLKSRPGKGHSA